MTPNDAAGETPSADTAPTTPLTAETLFGEPQPAAVPPTAPPDGLPRPRIRWGGVVWGALFAAFGIATMAVLSTTSSQTAFGSWVAGLGPGGVGVVALVAVGVLLLILGILSALGRAARAAG